MREYVLPRPIDIGMFFLAALLVAAVAGGTFYVTDLQAERAQLSARVGALERRPAQQVTVTPSPSPTQSSESPDSGSPEPPSGPSGVLVAAAPGGGESAGGRSPQRQPPTGGSSNPPDSSPPIAAPPESESGESCSARLLALCVRADLGIGD